MNKILLLGSVLCCLVACSSLEKSNVSGASVSIEKDGVIVSAGIQTNEVETLPADEEIIE